MTRIIRNLIQGVGSALEIWPKSQHGNYYSKMYPTPDHAIRQDFDNVGRDMSNAWYKVANVEEKENEEENRIASKAE
jgi:hypothetical protein